jgi:hypothetical protein
VVLAIDHDHRMAFVLGCVLLLLGVATVLAAALLHVLRVARLRSGFLLVELAGLGLLALAGNLPTALGTVVGWTGLVLAVPVALAYALFWPRRSVPPPASAADIATRREEVQAPTDAR